VDSFPPLSSFLIVSSVSAALTALVVPVMIWIAKRSGMVVPPDERRIHTTPTPNLGGFGLLVGVIGGLAVASRLGGFEPVFDSSTEVLGIVIGALIIYIVGLVDDVRDVSAPAKTAGIVLAAAALTFAGVAILVFRIPFLDFVVLSPDLSALVTVLWVIGMANAVNIIDGLDGLAAGIVGIAAAAFFLYDRQLASAGLLDADNPSPLIATVVVGVCLGFLPYNFHPARTFMGDGGALLLGLLMAAATIAVGGRTADQFSGQTYFFFAPLFIPLFILGVPIVDTVFAIVRRAVGRKGVATADKGHLHHRLMDLGHGQRRSVLILWAWTALLSALVLYPTFTGKGDALVPLALLAAGLVLYTLFSPGRRRRTATGRSATPEAADTDAADAESPPSPPSPEAAPLNSP